MLTVPVFQFHALTNWHIMLFAGSHAHQSSDASPGNGPPQRDNSQNATLAKCFTVDTLNIKGALNVCVMTEGVTKAKEVAKIEIPVFNLLDCCFALSEGQYYDRWFPLILSSESMPCEGECTAYALFCNYACADVCTMCILCNGMFYGHHSCFFSFTTAQKHHACVLFCSS